MKWTKEPPKEAGHYWYRYGNGGPWIGQLVKFAPMLPGVWYVFGSDTEEYSEELCRSGAEFWPIPIPAPQEEP